MDPSERRVRSALATATAVAPILGVTACVASAAALASSTGAPADVAGLVVFAIGVALAIVPHATRAVSEAV